MKSLIRSCFAGLVLAPGLVLAAYNCTVSSPGFTTTYSPSSPTTTIVQTSFTVSCTRALSDASTMSWSNAANNGLYPVGANNRAASGGSYIRYDVFKDSACGTQWKGSAAFSGTLAFGGATSASTTVSYWGCIGAGQTGVPAGTYADTVTMTLSYGPNPQSTATGTFPVGIGTPPTCNVTTPPGDIIFNYTSLGAAVNASTAFGVTCTTYLPYTMALDATSGALLGLTYTLATSAASATGTGAQQLYSINGSIAGGQAGTCAVGTCSASALRTLTVTY